MKLSILICSLHKRKEFLNKLLDSLNSQTDGIYSDSIAKNKGCDILIRTYQDFEIIIATDNKNLTVGAKRNLLRSYVKNEYQCFIDDDDRVTNDYLPIILTAINNPDNLDSVVFKVLYNPNKGESKEAIYSASYIDKTYPDKFTRATNHLMVIKTEIANKVPFKNISFGEDSDFARNVVRLIKTEGAIDKVLYYYDFNSETSETQIRR